MSLQPGLLTLCLTTAWVLPPLPKAPPPRSLTRHPAVLRPVALTPEAPPRPLPRDGGPCRLVRPGSQDPAPRGVQAFPAGMRF